MVEASGGRGNVHFSHSNRATQLIGQHVVTLALVITLLMSACAGTGSSGAEPDAVGDDEVSSSTQPTRDIAPPASDDVVDSIVRIIGFGCGAPAFGSGFGLQPDLVITSGHLVTGRDPDTLAVLMTDGTEVGATLVGFDLDLDLAALRLDEPILEPVNLVTEVPVVSGVAVGIRSDNGEPIINEVAFDVDAPVIVNWDGVFRDTESRFNGLRIFAEIRRGDSGSPLFINDRDVIGLIHSKNRTGVPRGYAVGASDIVDFIAEIDTSQEVVADRCA